MIRENRTSYRRGNQPFPGQLSFDSVLYPIGKRQLHVPRPLLDQGLRAFHPRPYASNGKLYTPFDFTDTHREPLLTAWQDYPSVQGQPGHAWASVVLDVDGIDVVAGVFQRMGLDFPTPNWIVSRPGGGAHCTWCLADPVHRGIQARGRPLRLFQRVSDWLAWVLGADPGFNRSGLTHNPLYVGSKAQLETTWLRSAPYQLAELAAWISKGWTRPIDVGGKAVELGTVGRNNDIHRLAIRLAGSYRNELVDSDELVRQATEYVSEHYYPVMLGARELAKIAKSVSKKRETFDYWLPPTPAEQSRRGRKSGKVRRAATRGRDGEIRRALDGGMSKAAATRLFDVSPATVHRVLQRAVQETFSS